jgi:hypothetical protein
MMLDIPAEILTRWPAIQRRLLRRTHSEHGRAVKGHQSRLTDG